MDLSDRKFTHLLAKLSGATIKNLGKFNFCLRKKDKFKKYSFVCKYIPIKAKIVSQNIQIAPNNEKKHIINTEPNFISCVRSTHMCEV